MKINTSVAGPIVINITNAANQTIHSLSDTTASLSVTGGLLKIAADSSITPNLTVAGGSLTASGQLNVGGTFTQSGGTFTGTGTLTLTGQMVWSGGSMAGGGTTVLAVAATGTISGTSNTKGLDRILDNTGTLTYSGNSLTFDANGDGPGVLNNLAGASFTDSGSGSLNHNFNNAGNGITNQGTFLVTGTGITNVNVAFSNSGSVQVQAGTLSLQGAFSNFSGTTLSGGTYIVHSTLQFNNANIQNNEANIVLDGPASQIINQNGNDALATFATNASAGSFTVQNGRNLTTVEPFNNSGNVMIGSGSTFTANSYTQNGGTTQLAGGALTATGGVNIAGGTLTGNGTVTGNLNDGGTVAPGSSTTPGKLTINGSYTQTAGGALDTKIAGRNTPGADYDQLVVSGAASLGGTINASIVNGFTPQSGDQYQIIEFASSSGDFTTRNGFSLSSGNVLAEQFSPSNLTLVVNQPRLKFLTEPGSSAAGRPINPAVQVEILDGSGNLITSDNSDVITMTVNQNGFDPSSTVTATASGGVATFSNLIIDLAAGGYQLTASNPTLGSAVSAPPFSISPDVPAQLVFLAQPQTSAHVGDTLNSFQVQVRDRVGNPEANYSTPITLSLSSNATALGGTDPEPVSGSIATFGDLTVSQAGTYQLKATSGSLSTQASASFTINPLDTAVAVNSVLPDQLPASNSPQTVNLSATVTNLDNSFPVNEGTISFQVYDPNNNPVGPAGVSGTVSGGSASAAFTFPANINALTGIYTVVATYQPGPEFLGSVSSGNGTGSFNIVPPPSAQTISTLAQGLNEVLKANLGAAIAGSDAFRNIIPLTGTTFGEVTGLASEFQAAFTPVANAISAGGGDVSAVAANLAALTTSGQGFSITGPDDDGNLEITYSTSLANPSVAGMPGLTAGGSFSIGNYLNLPSLNIAPGTTGSLSGTFSITYGEQDGSFYVNSGPLFHYAAFNTPSISVGSLQKLTIGGNSAFSASLSNIGLNVSVPFSVSLDASSGSQLSADDLADIADHVSVSLSNDKASGPSVGLSGDVVCSVLGIDVDWHVSVQLEVNASDGTVITPTFDNGGIMVSQPLFALPGQQPTDNPSEIEAELASNLLSAVLPNAPFGLPPVQPTAQPVRHRPEGSPAVDRRPVGASGRFPGRPGDRRFR